MKNILLIGCLFLVYMCNKSSAEDKLNRVINSYENYQVKGIEDSPLGEFTENRFEKYASFCDSINTELKSIDPKNLNEDARISYTLLQFSLKEIKALFKHVGVLFMILFQKMNYLKLKENLQQ